MYHHLDQRRSAIIPAQQAPGAATVACTPGLKGLPGSAYLISVLSRGPHGAGWTGEPHRALETVAASWALGPFLPLQRRGDLRSNTAHPPERGPRAGGWQFPGSGASTALRTPARPPSLPAPPTPCTSAFHSCPP